MGQDLGWRATFLGVSAIGLAAIAALALLIPRDHTHATAAGLRHELAALRSVPVWLALGTTVAGFGALFAAYSYVTPMLTDSAGFAPASVTLLLALFGVGATAGNLLGGRLADHAMRGTLFGGLAALGVVLALFPVLMRAEWSAALGVTLLGMAAFVTGSPLQLMVMEKAAAAPSLASSANQAAFNLANAGGAWTYCVDGKDVIDGYGVHEMATGGRGQQLIPWPNRLQDGSFEFGDAWASTSADRAGAFECDPRPRALGLVAGARARGAPRRARIRPSSTARVSVFARPRGRVRAGGERPHRSNDCDEHRDGRLPVRKRRASISHAGHGYDRRSAAQGARANSAQLGRPRDPGRHRRG